MGALLVVVVMLGLGTSFPPQVRAVPVRAELARRIAAPSEATALRFSVYGDRSGARLQMRLVTSPGETGPGTPWTAPSLPIDFAGWKTVIVPLADFKAPSTSAGLAPAAIHAVHLAVTTTSSRILLDDLVWTTAGASVTDAPLQVIDDFEAAPTAWTAENGYEQTHGLKFSLNKTPALVKKGAGSLLVVVRSRASADRELYTPALMARLKRAPVPYVVYVRPPFETIVPESTPAPTEIQAQPKLSVFACTDEIEPTTFAVYAGKNLRDASVTIASDFVSDSKKARLPRAAIDVHLVQAQIGADATSAAQTDDPEVVPELLVKDDRAVLGAASAPATAAQTDIPAQSSKQFWITIRVPKLQPVSTYTGRLMFSAPGVKPTPITLSIEVLPMRLRRPFLQYGLDFRARLSPDGAGRGETVVTPEVLAKQLANVRDHGFRLVSLYEPLSTLADVLKHYKEAGLSQSGPVVLMSPLTRKEDWEKIESLRTNLALGPDFEFYYGFPSAPANPEPDQVKQELALARHAGPKTALLARVRDQASYHALVSALNEKQQDRLVFVYDVASDYAQKLLATGKRENPNRDWWSWNLAEANPRMNRLYAGYLLYQTGINGSGFYGAFVRTNPGPAVGEVAEEATSPATEGLTLARPYISKNAVGDPATDTLQWEAAREGIDDIRYLTNLKTYLREVKDLKIRKDATDEAELFLQKALSRSLVNVSPGELQTIRRGVADRSLKLLTILRGSATRFPD